MVLPRLLVDGRSPDVNSLSPFALANDGHFTAMQVRGGATRGLNLHLGRLAAAHEELYTSKLDENWLRECMREAIVEAPNCYLRVTVVESEPGELHVLTVSRPSVEVATEPVRLTSVAWTRALPHIKHVGTFPQIYFARSSEAKGFDDAVLVGADGLIAETTIQTSLSSKTGG